jgi:hypothetical protein
MDVNLSTKEIEMGKTRLVVWLFVLALLAAPALALDPVIYNGIDLWSTRGDGSTFTDFSANPLPAGFFCHNSEAFSGRIGFQGVPVATGVPGTLGRTDTIVQRLDNAVFNKRGVAFTRLQVRALTFQSIAPIQTSCGAFKATVTLDGEQPITRMQIVRENAQGGRFYAPISVNVKISFTPIGRAATERLEIQKSLRFPPLANQRWSSVPAQARNQVKGFLLVDTDGDGIPDTYLPGTSNFGVGQLRPTKGTAVLIDCHVSDGCDHCVS